MKKDKISSIKDTILQNKKQEPSIKKEEVGHEEVNYKDKYLRTLAELENTRKRMQKEKLETLRFAIENTICDFLPILDNFENALKFSKEASEEVKNWANGFQMIHSQLKELLHSNGIVPFHSKGNIFDPNFHEAMEIIENHEHPDGMILEELSKGYKSSTRTVRPAKVKVSKKPKKENNYEEKQ